MPSRILLVKAILIPVFLIVVTMSVGCQRKTDTERYNLWPEHVDLGFVRNSSNLVLLNLDGNLNGTVVATSNPSVLADTWFLWDWTKDGENIVYEDSKAVYIFGESGEREKIASNALLFCLSPDGNRLAYTEKVPIEELPDELRESGNKYGTYFTRLKAVDIDSQEIQLIGEGDIFSFDWTYDSKNIVYVNNYTNHADGVYMHNILTEEDKRLLDAGNGSYYKDVSCSPSAPLLAANKWDGHDIFHLYLYSYQDGNLKEIYDEHSSSGAVWFPSGEYLMTINEKSTQEGGLNDILVMDLDGNVIHSLDNHDEAFSWDGGDGINGCLSVSPDETRIAFQRSSNETRGIWDIYIWDISQDRQNPDGSMEHHIERITSDGSSCVPQWRPE